MIFLIRQSRQQKKWFCKLSPNISLFTNHLWHKILVQEHTGPGGPSSWNNTRALYKDQQDQEDPWNIRNQLWTIVYLSAWTSRDLKMKITNEETWIRRFFTRKWGGLRILKRGCTVEAIFRAKFLAQTSFAFYTMPILAIFNIFKVFYIWSERLRLLIMVITTTASCFLPENLLSHFRVADLSITQKNFAEWVKTKFGDDDDLGAQLSVGEDDD